MNVRTMSTLSTSNDEVYGFGTGLKYWALEHQDLAIGNADSLACHVSFFDDRVLW
ncbi:hypothetical protein [Burkholderia sp. F1]|uniref:hypothetical protein n=1 Tax=Burkholderia sp. F1 TaxID=3366817 RepID=UPI003D7560B3